MLKNLIVLICTLLALLCFALNAKSLNVSELPTHAIGSYFTVIEEQQVELSVEQAMQFINEHGKFLNSEHLNYGLWSRPVWLEVKLSNSEAVSLVKRLTLAISWIDELDIYLVQNSQVLQTYNLGDSLPFSQRVIDSRYLSADINIPSGESKLYIRASTPDPLVLSFYLQSVESQQNMMQAEGYRYGIVYGAIIALLIYNLFLGVSLKIPVNLYYSAYMMAYLLMNFSYTGHSAQWFWPNSDIMQKWGNPLFMLTFNMFGLVFAKKFLALKLNFPTLNYWLSWSMVTCCVLMVIGIGADIHHFVLFLAFLCMLLFTFTMMILGIIAYHKKLRAAVYFLSATIMGVGGTLITCLTVWGFVPYSPFAYMAIDYGMILEALILSLALANKFHEAEQEKKVALQLAQVDPLTNLSNRRAVYSLAPHYSQRCSKNNSSIAVIMFDLDNFKAINDTYSHEVGDEVLKLVANTLLQHARKGDLIARWGGEEFIALLPETDLYKASFIAERYRLAIDSLNFYHQARKIDISASIGVAASHAGFTNLEQVIASADDNLYQAKRLGKNQVVFC